MYDNRITQTHHRGCMQLPASNLSEDINIIYCIEYDKESFMPLAGCQMVKLTSWQVPELDFESNSSWFWPWTCVWGTAKLPSLTVSWHARHPHTLKFWGLAEWFPHSLSSCQVIWTWQPHTLKFMKLAWQPENGLSSCQVVWTWQPHTLKFIKFAWKPEMQLVNLAAYFRNPFENLAQGFRK